MNRKKKTNQILSKKSKKAAAKRSSKPRYIAKADRIDATAASVDSDQSSD